MLLDVRAWWRDDLLPRGRELAGGNDDVLVVGAGFAAMMFTYWAYGLAWLAVDLARAPACLMRRRSQPARPFRVEGTSYAPPLSALLRNVVVNQVSVSRGQRLQNLRNLFSAFFSIFTRAKQNNISTTENSVVLTVLILFYVFFVFFFFIFLCGLYIHVKIK